MQVWLAEARVCAQHVCLQTLHQAAKSIVSSFLSFLLTCPLLNPAGSMSTAMQDSLAANDQELLHYNCDPIGHDA